MTTKIKIIVLNIFIIICSANYLFSATYTSVTSGNFTSPATWGVASIAAGNHNYVISTTHTVTLIAPPTVLSLNIQSGATFNNGNFNITMAGAYCNHGIHNGTGNLYYNNFSPASFTGSGITNCDIEIMNGGPTFEIGCTITINANIFVPISGYFSIENYGQITVNGNISGPFPSSTSGNIRNYSGATINQTGNTSIYYGSWIDNFGTYNISGNLILGDNITYVINESLASFTVGGDLLGWGTEQSFFLQEANAIAKFGGSVFPTTNDGELCASGISAAYAISVEPNTIEYNGSLNQVIKAPSTALAFGGTYLLNTYSNLIASNNSIKSLSANTTINGNLTIKDIAQLDVTATPFNINIKENWINISANTNPFVEQTGIVTFNGNTAQSISANLVGGETFYNLTINNTSTGLTQVNNTITVTNTLALITGLVHTGIYETNVTNNAIAAVTSYSTASYINGNLRRNLLTTGGIYDFPVGNSNAYQLASVNFTAAHTIGDLLVNFSNLPAGTGLPLAEGANTFATVLNCGGTASGTGSANDGVWTITPNAGTANYDLTLNGKNYSNAGTANTILKRVDASSPWTLQGSYIPASGAEPMIASRTGYSGFSQFAIGGGSIIVLPIELLSFEGNCIPLPNGEWQEVELNWATASETNNDYFTIERSTDAINWEIAGTVDGAGNSTITRNYKFIDQFSSLQDGWGGILYYRLKQTDFNKNSKTSDLIYCNCNANESIKLLIHPNPTANYLNITFFSKQIQSVLLTITDLYGNIIKTEYISTQGNLNEIYTINLNLFKQGIYFLNAKSAENIFITKFIKQ